MPSSPIPPGPSALVPLDRIPVEVEARVVDVTPAHRSELAGEGLRVGRTIRVTGRAPFGGPVLLMVGRARLAVSRSVAAGILVEPVESAHADGGAPGAATSPRRAAL
jgi:Fe2+ transport system protein FeoA